MRLLIIVLGSLWLTACSTPAPAPALDGDTLASALQTSGLPVAQVQTYTSETDPNNLLGRPNQYTAKVSWFDTRITPQDGLSAATAEVFPDAASLDARYKYTDAISKSAAPFAQYLYRNDARRVLLRLPHDLTPDQAAEYQKWLAAL